MQDGVYRQLCRLILEGGLAPGESITVAKLADAFGVSPMPVREALARLTNVGALTTVSGRTVGIPALSRERLIDLRRVRLDVETTATRWAIEQSGEDLPSGLDERLAKLSEAEAREDTQSYVSANYDFHFAIYRAAGSPLMLSFIETLWLQISPFFHLLRTSGNYRFSNIQHEAIRNAIHERDTDAAVAALTADIEGAYQALLAILQD
ncbi:GntR family transcriptional regulator [Jiella marina]|uniref:GntR family transcriptional regulator n=1 Tax=Jiella sp. LLJ827 TaxID=2917712 RepID=UPI002100EF6C|nr:GntR family transcriptional regulator [Jiella sp. LLJ827]MCQ0986058.1 GntR family transcriptional regulator [Jiella sp. LLJ827]